MPIKDATFHGRKSVFHPDLVNIYGCEVGFGTKIGPFVEIQKGVKIGDRCIISSHSFICEGVEIKHSVFVGHGVMFCNEKFPQANRSTQWKLKDENRVLVKEKARIGSGSVILPGVTIGRGALVGAGSVVTKNVPAFATVYGNPARTKEEWEAIYEDLQRGHRCRCGEAIQPVISPLGS